jgi:hypothetical protein
MTGTNRADKYSAFLLNDEECDEPGIPSFEISDDSSITVVELKSKIQTAAAIYGLSWKDFEVALYVYTKQ